MRIKYLIIGAAALLLFSIAGYVKAAGELWRVQGSAVRPVVNGYRVDAPGGLSGSALTVSGARNCSGLQTNASGVASCGSGGGGSVNTGAILNAANDRFVNVSGDTMTGSLVIQNGTSHTSTTTALLRVRGTMSGYNVFTNGTLSGANLRATGSAYSYVTGNLGIGTSAPKAKFDVVGTISGSALRLNGDAIVRMTSTSASGVVINGLAGQVSPFVSFRNAAGFAKLQVNSSGYLQSQSGITVVSRPNMGSFGGDFTFQIKRDGSNNFGNGAILRFTDNNTNAYIKWVAQSFSQGVMDLEFHNANGLNMSMPNAGGIYMYNPVQNSQDISILKVPTSTLYPGGGTWPYQAVFKFDPQKFAGTSPLTVTRAIQLYIRSAPIRGGNMTFSKSTAAQFDTGGSNYRGLIIRGGNSQSGALMEFTNTGHTILSAFTASGYLALGGQNVKKSLVLEAYGSMSGSRLVVSGDSMMSGALVVKGNITSRGTISGALLSVDSVMVGSGNVATQFTTINNSRTVRNAPTYKTFSQTGSIKVNDLRVGDSYRITISGTGSVDGVSPTFLLRFGNTDVISMSGSINPGFNQTQWVGEFVLTFRSIGASADVRSFIRLTNLGTIYTKGASATVNATSNIPVSIWAKMTETAETPNAGDYIDMTQFIIEKIPVAQTQ